MKRLRYRFLHRLRPLRLSIKGRKQSSTQTRTPQETGGFRSRWRPSPKRTKASGCSHCWRRLPMHSSALHGVKPECKSAACRSYFCPPSSNLCIHPSRKCNSYCIKNPIGPRPRTREEHGLTAKTGTPFPTPDACPKKPRCRTTIHDSLANQGFQPIRHD